MSLNKKSNFQVLIKVFALTKDFKHYIWLAVITTLLLALVSPLRPWLIQKAINEYAATNQLDGLQFISLILLILIIFGTLLQFFNDYITGWIAQKVILVLRMKVFNHVLKNRLTYFDQTPVGTLTTRTVSDIETVSELFAEGIITILGDVLQIIAISFFMLYIDWKLTLISLSVLPILFYSSHVFRIKVKESFHEVRNAVSNLNTFVQEQITGIHITQVFNQNKKVYKEFEKINHQHYTANHKSVMYYSVFFPVLEVITSISVALLILYSANRLKINHQFDYGVITAFILYINMFFRPVRILADRFNNIQMGIVASERLFTLLEYDQLQENNYGTVVKSIKGEIEFDDVSFSYNDKQEVLKNVSFSLQNGETLAIIGSTGAGKSTIVNLITDLYPINSGKIKIDGIEHTNFDKQSLRSQISVVNQDVFLFSGSVYENINLGNPSLSKEQVMKLIDEIQVLDFVQKLPDGLDYKVMERGNTLSAGQKQIISLVRTIISNPKVIILDEATSSVDTETEIIIQKTINYLLEKRTGIVIAHRLSTIKKADKILFLDKGKVVEYGKNSELLKNKGYYYNWLNSSDFSEKVKIH